MPASVARTLIVSAPAAALEEHDLEVGVGDQARRRAGDRADGRRSAVECHRVGTGIGRILKAGHVAVGGGLAAVDRRAPARGSRLQRGQVIEIVGSTLARGQEADGSREGQQVEDVAGVVVADAGVVVAKQSRA